VLSIALAGIVVAVFIVGMLFIAKPLTAWKEFYNDAEREADDLFKKDK
jgi:hypothetical protein